MDRVCGTVPFRDCTGTSACKQSLQLPVVMSFALHAHDLCDTKQHQQRDLPAPLHHPNTFIPPLLPTDRTTDRTPTLDASPLLSEVPTPLAPPIRPAVGIWCPPIADCGCDGSCMTVFFTTTFCPVAAAAAAAASCTLTRPLPPAAAAAGCCCGSGPPSWGATPNKEAEGRPGFCVHATGSPP